MFGLNKIKETSEAVTPSKLNVPVIPSLCGRENDDNPSTVKILETDFLFQLT